MTTVLLHSLMSTGEEKKNFFSIVSHLYFSEHLIFGNHYTHYSCKRSVSCSVFFLSLSSIICDGGGFEECAGAAKLGKRFGAKYRKMVVVEMPPSRKI